MSFALIVFCLATIADDELGAQVSRLQADPAFAGLSWTIKSATAYAPFAFVIGETGEPSSDYASEIEANYGPALGSMREMWQRQFANRLKLKPISTPLPLIMLPDWDRYRRVFGQKVSTAQGVPPAFVLETVPVTYYRRQKYQSTLARRRAILDAAAKRLLARSTSGEKPVTLPAWLELGLGAHLAEGGVAGDAAAEIPLWRQDFAQLADALARAGVKVPSLAEWASIGSLAQVEEQEARLGAGPDGELTAFYHRSYVRLAGYSLILFAAADDGALHRADFWRHVEAAFRGDRKPLASSAEKLLQLEAAWRSFCAWEAAPAATVAAAAAAASPAAPAPTAPAAPVEAKAEPTASPPPAWLDVLDLRPHDQLEFRAEAIRRIRAGALREALAMFADDEWQRALSSKEFVAADRQLLEAPLGIYRRFASMCETGDTLPTGVGLTGRIGQRNEQGFELEVKGKTERHDWTALNPVGVAARVFSDLKFDDARPALDVALSCALGGDLARARKYLGQAHDKGAKPDAIKATEATVRELEPAVREADARDAIDEALRDDALSVLTPIRKLLKSDVTGTAAFARAKSYLRRLAAEAETRKFRVANLFAGESTGTKDSLVTVRYAFLSDAELADWSASPGPALCTSLELPAAGGGGHVQKNLLVLAPAGILRHRAAWLGDVTLEVTATQAAAGDEGSERRPSQLVAGWCDAAGGDFFGSRNASAAVVSGSDRLCSPPGPLAWLPDVDYHLVLARRGDQLSVVRNNQDAATVEVKAASGKVSAFLAACGSRSHRIKDVVLSGRLDPQWFHDERSARVALQMKTMFGD